MNPGQRKFAKPELAYGLAKGGQTDSQVGSQVAKSRKFHAYHWLMRFYNNRLLAINLCRLALGGQTVKNLRLLASKFELDQSQRKSTQVDAIRRKSTQVGGQTKRKLNASRKLALTCVDLRVRGKDFRPFLIFESKSTAMTNETPENSHDGKVALVLLSLLERGQQH